MPTAASPFPSLLWFLSVSRFSHGLPSLLAHSDCSIFSLRYCTVPPTRSIHTHCIREHADMPDVEDPSRIAAMSALLYVSFVGTASSWGLFIACLARALLLVRLYRQHLQGPRRTRMSREQLLVAYALGALTLRLLG